MAQNKSYKEMMKQQGSSTGTSQEKANAMLELIEGREPFSYDSATDPTAKAVRQETARNIARTTRNTMGNYASMTGGMPSSAAVSAAAQAGNQAAVQGADQIAELEELARSRYQQETADMQNMWAAYQNQADSEYNQKYQLALLAAQYGDYSGLKELGVDTSKAASYGGSESENGETQQQTELSAGLDAATINNLMLTYNGTVLPASVWAQYDEAALKAAGFTREQSQQNQRGQGSNAKVTDRNPGLAKGESELRTWD